MHHLFELIEYTNRSIFLTGRAGTGKTTFLQNFVQKTAKKFAIVAPTGIAAINAGGITIHSMFGLPLTTFAPTAEFIDRNEAINIPNLLPHFKYRRDKLKLLRTLEILIIDEVSMLRCDVLDMMDLALRSARKSQQRFGGLQILFIGDLHQLPPVVKSESETILYSYYNSPFFFEAKALEGLSLLTVSLTKVYRQTDAVFLQMLNAIRDNDLQNINFDLLHSRYQPEFEPEEFYVHLVSHNYMADAINKQQLKALPGKSRIYRANIQGEFKPHLFPNEEELELKEGAQIMFIRNDKEEKRFYNGKLATVVELKDDEIKVLPQDETRELTIVREKWENKKYFIDQENNVAEDVIGSYEQFPFKLAWAVTIHKSQGLTFDKVIIDAGRSFTSGQVYVALSRCRTLEGIVLKSKIPANAIINDDRIHRFQQETDAGDQIAAIVAAEQYNYAGNKLLQKLNLQQLSAEAEEWEKAIGESAVLDSEEVMRVASEVAIQIKELEDVLEKFSNYLNQKLKLYTQTQEDWKAIEDKSKGAVNFFFKKMNENVFDVIKECYAETKGAKGLKGYNDVLKNFIDVTAAYLSSLKEAKLFDTVLYEGEMAKIITVVAKKPTHIISYQLFDEGKSPKEIAELRSITEGTVLGHLAKMAAVGVLDIHGLFTAEQIKLFEDRFRKQPFKTVTEWKNALPDSFDYNEIRILLNHFTYQFGKQASS
ncbi:helix-turn-helix domain-containing protein [Niabella ginsengisoli]|uniref:Helix-turn-helix domain-containing protein n=1 Tax=Niabella ginsengisoli TaxID=522298 RepID=A0ABS9SDR9_9BACT|nr:helix-turn-helix domain-containing protein [Niabella ginsengisoli]MCH5596499.1 helix-turn-helix domain-containing protein [Niabella ginsengisoli]